MPELPEVETINRDLARCIVGATITEIRIFDPRVIRGISPKKFYSRLKGQKIRAIHRRGKALIFDLDPGPEHLVVQLMMTGQLICLTKFRQQKSTKIVFLLSKGQYLLYNDQRVFGRLQIVTDLSEIKYFRILGPEPLSRDFSMDGLRSSLQRSRRPIKNFLLDHSIVAGIGNIYAAEILFESGIRPQRLACRIKKQEAAKLFGAVQKVLRQAVRYRGTSMNTYRDASGQRGNFMTQIKVYGREGEPCVPCGQKIRRQVMAGRSTFFCPQCQK